MGLKFGRRPNNDNNEKEFATLPEVLQESEQPLEELTAGEFDSEKITEDGVLPPGNNPEEFEQSDLARQAAILNALPEPIALLDFEGAIISANDRWRQFATANSLCWGPGPGVGVNYLTVCDNATGPGWQDARIAAEGIRSVLSGIRGSFSFEYETDSPVESRRFQLTVSPLSRENPKSVIIKHGDISASKHEQSELVALAKRLSIATEVAKVGVWEWEVASNVLIWDETMYAIYGFPQMVAMTYEKWSNAVHPEDLPAVESKLQSAIHQRTDERAEFRITAVDGTTRHITAAERAVADMSGGTLRVIGVNMDVTERKTAEEELRRTQAIMTQLVEQDFLTGLPNQRVLRDRIEQAIKMATRNQKKLAVLFLDLDGFKHINESLGKPVGDKLLQSTARRLQEAMRASDTISRFGGETFIVLLPEVDHPEGTTIAATRLLDAIAAMHTVGEHELQVSACIGISVYPDDGEDGDTLIKNADLAMYQAKATGASSYQFFHPNMNIRAVERQFIEQNLRRTQAIMTELAEHDFLTGLPNQRVLRDRIEQAIKMATRNQKKLAILFLNLDGFKHINDSLGHTAGDTLLQSTARRLEEAVRASDTISRFGGDTFIVLLPEVDHPEATLISTTRLLDAIAAMHTVGQHELQVSACIGISVYPDDGEDGDTLIKNADLAMYEAKAKGGSSYQFFHPNMNVRAVERQFIEQNLRRALKRNELTLHYQPKVDLKSRAITGVEALLRWTHPVRGPISPATFIPVAEDCGLILPIGTWVLEEACRQARLWLDAGLPRINVPVNVSGRQFQAEGFEEKVMAVLNEFRIDPKYLELEVTEGLLMKAPEFTAKLLQSLRGRGVRVAIDDFGTGYSSLSYLRRFPIDTLKIDQSFIREIETPEGVSLVKAIIDLGRNLGMRLVAEGVETELEATMLEDMGCDRAQGYYLSRPLPPEEFASLLETFDSAERSFL